MEPEMTPVRFSASDATRAHGMHATREIQSYTKHLNACKVRLKRFISEHPDQTFLVYAVPMIVVGSALRDAKAILNHMIHRLREDGFTAHYLGSNLIFIQWQPSERHDWPKDYVQGAAHQRATHQTRASAVGASYPLTQENVQDLERRGPGPPVVVSDQDRVKFRLDNEIKKRLTSYEQNAQHPNAQRRKHFENYTTHQDALRAAVAPRTTL